jgi:hypothetical protein
MKRRNLINMRIGYTWNNVNYVKRYIQPKAYIFRMTVIDLIDYVTELITVTHNETMKDLEIVMIMITDEQDHDITTLYPSLYGIYGDDEY